MPKFRYAKPAPIKWYGYFPAAILRRIYSGGFTFYCRYGPCGYGYRFDRKKTIKYSVVSWVGVVQSGRVRSCKLCSWRVLKLCVVRSAFHHHHWFAGTHVLAHQWLGNPISWSAVQLWNPIPSTNWSLPAASWQFQDMTEHYPLQLISGHCPVFILLHCTVFVWSYCFTVCCLLTICVILLVISSVTIGGREAAAPWLSSQLKWAPREHLKNLPI